MEAPRIRLVGTRLSPAVELMRWLFESHGWPYEERAHVPAFHALVSLRNGVPIELPLLITAQGAFGGLKSVIAFFDAAGRPGDRLFGEGFAERTENAALFDELHQNLFAPAVRIYYAHMLSVRRLVIRGAIERAPLWEKAFLRAFFPIWRAIMRRGLKLQKFRVSTDCETVDSAFARITALLADGRSFLGGAVPSGMDIVFAAFAAPIVLPAEYGARIPNVSEAPEALRMIVERYRDTPAGRLALRTYSHRSRPQAQMRIPRPTRSLLGAIATPSVLRSSRACSQRLDRAALRWVRVSWSSGGTMSPTFSSTTVTS